MKRLDTGGFDTVIVVGGVAGLSAAASLGAAGQRVALLEARARLGGRVLSLTDPDLLVPAELGAEFVHGRTAANSGLLRRYGLVPVETGGRQHLFFPVVRGRGTTLLTAARGGCLKGRAPTVFDGVDLARREAFALKLKSADRRAGDTFWLRYEVIGARGSAQAASQ